MNGELRERLRRELDELQRNTARVIRAARARTALARGIDRALPLLVLVPIAWIALRLLGGGAEVDGLLLLPATLLIPALSVLALVLLAFFREVDSPAALALLDRELELEDRLQTAAEFLELEESSAFVEAAIEDAASFVQCAREASIRIEAERWHFDRRASAFVAASLVLLNLAAWIGWPSPPREPGLEQPLERPNEVASVVVHEEPTETTPPAVEPREPRPVAKTTSNEPLKSAAVTARRDVVGEFSDVTKESSGKTGEGRSSDAESTSGASESRGVPSNQAQTSKASEKPSEKPLKKKKPKPPADDARRNDERQEEDSGSTAGKGSSRGSNKNPAVSRWASKDQVTTEDDQELEDDQDTEDEEEDQESRGGMQPHLRDRKPPVSRDLRIGFGNQPDPDANGRGGPSELKKSRGTASLVLGVPIPDRVKGQPNPGKTKITQERIEPRAEESSAIDAAARRARQAPIGHLPRRDLDPWMRTLVREYFLTLRQRRGES